jgi:hypothetical protein
MSRARLRRPQILRGSLRANVCAATVLALALAGPTVPTAGAHASSKDTHATRVYLEADYARTRTEVKRFPEAIATVHALAQRLQSECPGVLADIPKSLTGEPFTRSAAEIGEEETDAVFGAVAQGEYLLRSHFAATVAHLAWSDRALTKLVRSRASAEVAQAQTPAPSLCSDASAWVGSGYMSVSAATEAYVRQQSALATTIEGVEATIMRELKPYESQADRRLAARITKLEASALESDLKKLLTALGGVMEVLHSQAHSPSSAPAS